MISTLTIIISAVLLLLAIVSTLMDPFFRVPINKEANNNSHDDERGKDGLPLSVIVMVNDDIDILERNLPTLLNQEYEPGFQIIIVADKGNSQADDMIKRFGNNPHLTSTFIPNTFRYISREKLGITLGIKAARNEWCILMDGNSYPVSRHWLSHIGRQCSDEKNLIIGYSNYENGAKAYQRFYRLQHFAYLWRECMKGTPYSANGSNLAFRKSEFIKMDGFRGNLHIIRGEFDFIVNKFARKNSAVAVVSEESSLMETIPSDKQWHRRRIFHIHSCRYMQRGFRHRLLPCLDTFFLHLSCTLSICFVVLGAVFCNYILLCSAVLSLILLITSRIIIGKKTISAFHADISAWKIIPLELASIWHSLADRIRYYKADSYDFTCHKL
jgi:cellulose synthase/poly-beta-1,6-N-acetylglucosamine synthase-like glycosyltransferase